MFDNLFKIAILEKLYPWTLGCFISVLLILLLLIFCPEFIFIGIFIVIVSIVYLLISIKFHKKQKITCLSDEDKVKINLLAQDYINNLLKNDKKLSEEDYKQFNHIVQIENNIKISTNYAGVPYPIREILYTTYENKIKDIK